MDAAFHSKDHVGFLDVMERMELMVSKGRLEEMGLMAHQPLQHQDMTHVSSAQMLKLDRQEVQAPKDLQESQDVLGPMVVTVTEVHQVQWVQQVRRAGLVQLDERGLQGQQEQLERLQRLMVHLDCQDQWDLEVSQGSPDLQANEVRMDLWGKLVNLEREDHLVKMALMAKKALMVKLGLMGLVTTVLHQEQPQAIRFFSHFNMLNRCQLLYF